MHAKHTLSINTHKLARLPFFSPRAILTRPQDDVRQLNRLTSRVAIRLNLSLNGRIRGDLRRENQVRDPKLLPGADGVRGGDEVSEMAGGGCSRQQRRVWFTLLRNRFLRTRNI